MALWPSKKPTGLNAMDLSLGGLNAPGGLSQAYQSATHRLMMQQMQQMMGYPAPAAPVHKPSKDYPNTLGWRSWVWDMTAKELRSPIHATTWHGPELRCETWDENDVVRGVAGIHAHLVPDDWHTLTIPEAPNGGNAYAELREGKLRACVAIQGVVERFGKFVLGAEGWRAEWVIIRKLAAPTDEIGLALEKAFPEAEVIYGNR